MKHPTAPMLLLLGPSGSGKSTLAGALAESSGMLHIELDQWPADGVCLTKLRAEWDDFYNRKRPEALSRQLARRVAASGHNGTVVSVPSHIVLPASLIEHAKHCGISTVILYGTAKDCLKAFLQRESTSERSLDAKHWISNNAWVSLAHFRPEYAPYRLDAFHNGAHRAIEDLLSEVLAMVSANPFIETHPMAGRSRRVCSS